MNPPTQVTIRVESDDDDAHRVAAVLEALGYSVTRELEADSWEARLKWAVDRLSKRYGLSSREREILALLLDGKSRDEIGKKLDISRATVKWHKHNIFAKTNAGSADALLRRALKA